MRALAEAAQSVSRAVVSHGPSRELRTPSIECLAPILDPLGDIGYTSLGLDDTFPVLDGAVGVMDVYSDDDVNVCVFFVPPGVTLPLHDHPGMLGLTKVLVGSLLVQSFDWVDRDRMTARYTTDATLDAPATFALGPTNGSLHQLTGQGAFGAAFIDVAIPPYDDRLRECRYYEVCDSLPSYANDVGGRHAVLRAMLSGRSLCAQPAIPSRAYGAYRGRTMSIACRFGCSLAGDDEADHRAGRAARSAHGAVDDVRDAASLVGTRDSERGAGGGPLDPAIHAQSLPVAPSAFVLVSDRDVCPHHFGGDDDTKVLREVPCPASYRCKAVLFAGDAV